MSEASTNKEIYDAILVDEAQDFSESFLKLCYSIIKPADIQNRNNKRLIYAYDELQKLNGSNSLRNPTEIFEGIDFESYDPNKPQQDIILEKCYRNSAPVLVTAHALGFGIYRKNNRLVTMFRDKELWKDVGYKVEEGRLEFGEHVILKRDNETSPDFLIEKIKIEDIIIFAEFDSYENQMHKIADAIEKNLKKDELTFRDIIVIHPDAIKAKNDLAPLRGLLFQKGIESHLAGVNTSPDDFFIENSIAFTSIYRAKGNEAAMVYLVNADFCFEGPELIKKRNTLFTSLTRSKGWVRVCGVGDGMKGLIEEFNLVKQNKFKLDFKYPTVQEMDKLNVLHRDLSAKDKKALSETENDLKSLIDRFSSGELTKEFLSKDILDELKKLLDDE